MRYILALAEAIARPDALRPVCELKDTSACDLIMPGLSCRDNVVLFLRREMIVCCQRSREVRRGKVAKGSAMRVLAAGLVLSYDTRTALGRVAEATALQTVAVPDIVAVLLRKLVVAHRTE